MKLEDYGSLKRALGPDWHIAKTWLKERGMNYARFHGPYAMATQGDIGVFTNLSMLVETYGLSIQTFEHNVGSWLRCQSSFRGGSDDFKEFTDPIRRDLDMLTDIGWHLISKARLHSHQTSLTWQVDCVGEGSSFGIGITDFVEVSVDNVFDTFRHFESEAEKRSYFHDAYVETLTRVFDGLANTGR